MSMQDWTTHLEEACTNGDLDEVIRLTEQGGQSDFNDPAIHVAVAKAITHDHTEIVNYFLKSGMLTRYL